MHPRGKLLESFGIGGVAAEHSVELGEQRQCLVVALAEYRENVISHTDVADETYRVLSVADDVAEYIHNVAVLEADFAKKRLEFFIISVDI